MALVKSLVTGTAGSPLLANATHAEGGGDGGPLLVTHVEFSGHRIAWSWLVFAVLTVLVWLLSKAVNHSSIQ